MTPKSHIHKKKIKNLSRLSHLLDNAIPIPGTPYRIGLDPILGLLPGGGDTIGGALGAYIIIEAARMGIPRNILWEMVVNMLFDSLVGIVPVLGDIFDLGWKANVKNMKLLEKHLEISKDELKTDPLFIIGLIIILAAIVIGFAILTTSIALWLWNIISQNITG